MTFFCLACAKVEKNQVKTLKNKFQSNFKDGIVFKCSKLSYITRGRNTPFQVHTHISL